MKSFLLAAAFAAAVPASAAIVGPSPYLCFDAATAPGCGTSDSPFKSRSYNYFHLETFEDGLLNTPGVSGIGGSVYGPAGNGDSVDADSGPVDGWGYSGRSYFGFGYEFRFDAATLGQLPTDVGIVVTDGNSITVEFFDASSVLLGSGLFLGDGSINGETAEDRFIGWSGTTGVARVKLTSRGSGIEADHLQYGLFRADVPAVPEPATWAMLIAGFGLVGSAARRRRPTTAAC